MKVTCLSSLIKVIYSAINMQNETTIAQHLLAQNVLSNIYYLTNVFLIKQNNLAKHHLQPVL